MSDAWGRQSKAYAEKFQQGPPKVSAEAILKAIDTLLPLEKASAILDNGCGTGIGISTLIRSYSHRLPDSSRLVAADLSPKMVSAVEKIKESHPESNLWSKLELKVCDVNDMSCFDDASLSHIIASLVMFFSNDPDAAFNEAYRTLKPGGAIGMTSFQRIQWMDLRNVVQKIRPELAPPQLPPRWASAEWIREQCSKAGFVDVTVEPTDVFLEVDEPRELADFLVNSGIPQVSGIFGSLTTEQKNEVIDLIVKEVNTNYQKPIRIPGVLLVSSATRRAAK
ncbi:LADA_0B00166g1_1 [Lachancea dasiensis]|uniref:LADA_0B00166g1_1 n=1 Tax=Lachancea dasiensis TaxID=1072105 RepID=A0A1G4IRB1_9SACH|nr:LADA_0B00166g1_1 [Lachancea dasiensis]